MYVHADERVQKVVRKNVYFLCVSLSLQKISLALISHVEVNKPNVVGL